VVIANAGLLAKAATLRNTPIGDLESTLAVNVTGVVNTVAAGLEAVIASRGQIVLISSVFAFVNRYGDDPVRHEQGGRRAAGARIARGARRARGVCRHGVLLVSAGAARHPPGAVARPDHPTAAATAIADGLERRSSRVIRPALWRPVSALRGLLGPALDARFAADRRILDVLSRLDARGASSRNLTSTKPSTRKKERA